MDNIVEKDRMISYCEKLIKKIDDIVSAKIITEADGKISEIHVISNSRRNPKQIVRDIESTLIAFLGSEIDHKKISVAQINSKDELTRAARLKISGISTNKAYHSLEVKVILSNSEGDIFEGVACGVASIKGRMRTTAQATINALQQLLTENSILSLEDVITFKIGDQKAVSTLISTVINEKDEHLLGCALIKQDIYEAVVAGVLSAINRRISLLAKQ